MIPIERFDTIQQAIECMNEWKERLCLHDWIIKIKLCEPHEFEENDRDGECEYVLMLKTAVIRILKPQYYGDRIMKYCAERILVHELLHCAWGHMDSEIEGLKRIIHCIQEDTAKAFICAKYNLPNDWFQNISYESEEK